VPSKRYAWAAPGDVNAFFGLMLDNVADLLLTVSLLAAVFGFPTTFALRNLVPGTAIGVLVGDLLFFVMALRLAQRTGRNNITAMPLGLDTPSTFGMVFFVLGPAFTAAKAAGMDELQAATHTWHLGICSIFLSGIFKFFCALGSNWIRRIMPRAGLLGSLTAVALVLISFLPLLEVLHVPVVGLTALAIILTTLTAQIPVPGKIPGALGALLVGGCLFYAMQAFGVLPEWQIPHDSLDPSAGLWPTEWLGAFSFGWVQALPEALKYLPVVLPFALATVIGGIDCTESAAAVGDEYDTGQVIAVEAFATVVAALCGGVIQTTPYIGHPAYKAMGGRAAYTLATALFVGSAGVLGYFGYLYHFIPKPTVFPILIFVGLEITAQSFLATPRRHYTAVALAVVPALAYLLLILADELVPPGTELRPDTQAKLETLRILANGFIVTSMIWAAALAALIDRQMWRAAVYFAICALFTLFGVMHSPFAGSPLYLPWQLEGKALSDVLHYAGGYMAVALLLLAWGGLRQITGAIDPPLEEEAVSH
jgi:AGZA family xanthine/uracil permease-like MFS transporter